MFIIDIDDTQERNFVNNLINKIINSRILMSSISAVLKQAVSDRFRDESDGTSKWVPLSYETIRSRRDVVSHRKNMNNAKTEKGKESNQGKMISSMGSVKMLQDTGTLRRSVDEWYNNNEAGIGTNVEYAEYQQLGTKYIPSRPFISLNAREEDKIANLAIKYLERSY